MEERKAIEVNPSLFKEINSFRSSAERATDSPNFGALRAKGEMPRSTFSPMKEPVVEQTA